MTKASQRKFRRYRGAIISILCRDRLGTQTHRVAVLDDSGRVLEQYDADHSGERLVVLVNKLKQRTTCEPASVAIGIEVAWGALVETLVESGFTLFSINPKQVDRFRDRFTVAGAKDDARGRAGAGHLSAHRQAELQAGRDRLPRGDSAARAFPLPGRAESRAQAGYQPLMAAASPVLPADAGHQSSCG